MLKYTLKLYLYYIGQLDMNRSSTSPFRGTAGTSTRTGGGIESA
jgi:hypothetical protein